MLAGRRAELPDFLTNAFSGDAHLNWLDALIRQVSALILGVVVSLVYRWARKGNGESQSIPTTLILLTLLIAAISAVIGDNVARAFSLVGALSIVRFRTVVEDTRDTAFVILAVGVGMAVGSGYLIIALLMIPLAAIGTAFYRGSRSNGERYRFTIRAGLAVRPETIEASLSQCVSDVRPIGLSTTRQGAVVEYRYEARLISVMDARQVMDRLLEMEGVVAVEIETP